MILTKKVEIILNGRTIQYYKSLGYKNLKPNGKIIIDIENLPKGSYSIISVECDVCHKIKDTDYYSYNKNIKKYNYYTCCQKCGTEKSKKTKKEKYGDENYNNKNKNKKTCLEKYGDENYNNINKNNKTCLEKYGVEYFVCSDEFNKKSKGTCLEKYGVDSYTKTDEYIQKSKGVCLEKYGVDSYTKTDEYNLKVQKTSLRKYGVKSPNQFECIFLKQQKSGYRLLFHENMKLNYRGTYEKDFLDFCFDNNIQIYKGKTVKYIYNDKEHYYFSDFYYEPKNLIIEIKSNWTYNKYLSINMIKKNSCIDFGYDFVFIVDKNYDNFKKIIILDNDNL